MNDRGATIASVALAKGLDNAIRAMREVELGAHIDSYTIPAVALDKMQAHFERLHALDCEVPDIITGMMVVSKLPAHYNIIQQISIMGTEARGIVGPGEAVEKAS